ncbi:MAG TPA: MotA/TolQ/ExbB proton channel family protein [Phenylobacterium sp.]|nr:MotA/TolQ/ExbB proton channel family protein [Phenylobacterium sp.]
MEPIYRASELLYYPALVGIIALLVYSLFEAGRLAMAGLARRSATAWLGAYARRTETGLSPAGLSVVPYLDLDATLNEAEVVALRRLEGVRMAARVTPMLGLIATLVPMGPALVALTANDLSQMAALLRNAFAAVVLALAAASVAFWVASVRKRWCAEELVAIEKRMGVSGGL